ncbi:MAG TPA: homoserine kinase [Candidatus Baltobacteraceae bacterium]|nr:homoserine kinase [Candidatus Baltobacteraceae bacterium]
MSSGRMSGSTTSFEVSVPASSANLGPGFDAIGLALELRVHAFVKPADALEIVFDTTRFRPTNMGFADEIIRGIRAVLGPDTEPRVRIRIHNLIPLGKGLGASAAGAVLGLTIGARLASEPPSLERLAQLACELEGHPDNALPALLGGIVVAAQPASGPPAYVRIAPIAGLRAVVVTPQIVLPTAAARSLLPQHYDRADVVFNIQRAALLAASLASGDLQSLKLATEDRIHQPYRAPLVPGFSEMLGFTGDGILAIALSGAGPSVIALVRDGGEDAGAAMCAAFAREGIKSEAFVLDIATVGASVFPLPERTAEKISN